MKRIYLLALLLLPALHAGAQEDDTKKKGPKAGQTLTIGTGGIKITDPKDTVEEKFEVLYGMMDLGVNLLDDKTNYKAAKTQQLLDGVSPAAARNESLFSLRSGKSINVNIYPIMLKWRPVKTKYEKLYISTGVGLQFYNFRFNKNVTYTNTTSTQVILDTTLHLSKNKLAFTYLSVPLQITSKTRIAPKTWLVYGVGVTGGYLLSSWTKQISSEHGKQKNFDRFNFRDFNACVTGEIGLDDYFRFYGSYQVTSLAEDGLDQHPFCIGLRLTGI